MTRKLFAVLLLSMAVAACDSVPTENESLKTNANAQPSPAPVQVPTPEPSPSVQPQLKAGDRVRVAINGTTAEGAVVSIDEKSGKVTVRLQGESKDRLVAIADVTRQ